MKYGRWVGHGQYKGDQWYGHFCDKCMKEECPRNHSRFADFDFGVPYTPFLTYGEQWPLTSLNRVAIAPCSQYLVHVKLYATTGYVRLLERGARSPHRSRAPISAEYSLARSHDPPPAVVQARGLDGARRRRARCRRTRRRRRSSVSDLLLHSFETAAATISASELSTCGPIAPRLRASPRILGTFSAREAPGRAWASEIHDGHWGCCCSASEAYRATVSAVLTSTAAQL